jgi:hypothetical protein
LDDSFLEAKGRLVPFDVLSVPFRKGDGEDGSGEPLAEILVESEVDREADPFDSLAALEVGRDSCVVPGVTTLCAAEASNATTPRSTDDATRSVNN